jgi:hypothetical protein
MHTRRQIALPSKRRELRRGPGIVPVEPQVFDLLVFLIRNRARAAVAYQSSRSARRTCPRISPAGKDVEWMLA